MHTVDRRAVHRLRAVPAGLPGRLHRARRRQRRAHRLGRLERRRRPRRRARATTATGSALDERRTPLPSARPAHRAGAAAPSPAAHRPRTRAARAATTSRAARRMKPPTSSRFFATLRDGQPAAGERAGVHSVFELLAAVLLSAQATDARRQQGDAARCSRSRRTPQQMLALGDAALERRTSRRSACTAPRRRTCIATCRILVEQHGGEVPRDARGAARRCPASAARPPTWCSTSPSASRRWRSTRTSSASPTAPAWRRASTPLEVETGLLRARARRTTCSDAHHWLILHGRYVCLARAAAVRGLRRGALVRLGAARLASRPPPTHRGRSRP